VDEMKCAELLSAIQLALPTAIKESQYVIQDKDKIISEAKQRANLIIEEAQKKANYLIDQSSVLKQADMEAQDIIGKAKQCNAMYEKEMQNRLDEMLKTTENNVKEIMSVVRDARECLRESVNNTDKKQPRKY
ncbi:MAG: hypothetical protein RR454_06165, partial [Clostridia bacterium]